MSTAKRLNVIAAVLAGVVGVCLVVPEGSAQPSGPEAASQEGVLLLRNGNLLQGRITQTGDRYDVALDGGEIHVKASDVEFFCRTLEEGYQLKRSLVPPGDVREHIELAQWCQRHGLLAPAAQELAQAKALAPTHPLIPLVERRIKTSLCQPEKAERAVEQVDMPPSRDELDQLVRGMPPGSVERFTQTVQPVLVNNCSTAACHGPQSESPFRLLHIPWGRPASRRLTQRNLHSTLQWVDRDDPAASPLLTVPVRPHGSAEAAVFTDQQVDQYQQIVDWVYRVAPKNGPVKTVSHEAEQQLPRQDKPPWLAMPAVHTAPGKSTGENSSDGVPGIPVTAPSTAADPLDPQTSIFDIDGSPPFGGAAIRRGATLPQFVPVDPFDPEIFNRRFFPESPGPAQGDTWPR